jgi:hypothetical protein
MFTTVHGLQDRTKLLGCDFEHMVVERKSLWAECGAVINFAVLQRHWTA